jgi:hypothetical protein
MEDSKAVVAAPEEPFFSAKLVRIGQGGQYLATTGSSQLAAFSDRIEIDGTAVSYFYLLGIQSYRYLGAYSHVLEVVYATADGARAERFFSLRSLIPDKAEQQLEELVSRVLAAKADFARGAARLVGESGPIEPAIKALSQIAPAAIRCRRLADIGNRPAAAVYSSRVAFPACCPVCLADARAVATLRLVNGVARYLPMGQMAEWLVPACDAHRRLGKAIALQRWSVDSSEIHLSFSSAAYAERFIEVNSVDHPRADNASLLAAEVARGTTFSVFSYSVGLLLYSVLCVSDVQRVELGASRVARGLPYSLLTAILGWWSLRGFILVIRVLALNFGGGTDVTPNVAAVARGEALLPNRGNGVRWRGWGWATRSAP